MKIGLLGLLWVIFGVVSVSCWAKLDFLRESYTPLWVCSGQKCTKLLDFLMFFKLNFWVTENFELWAKIVKGKCSQLLIACSIWNNLKNSTKTQNILLINTQVLPLLFAKRLNCVQNGNRCSSFALGNSQCPTDSQNQTLKIKMHQMGTTKNWFRFYTTL